MPHVYVCVYTYVHLCLQKPEGSLDLLDTLELESGVCELSGVVLGIKLESPRRALFTLTH